MYIITLSIATIINILYMLNYSTIICDTWASKTCDTGQQRGVNLWSQYHHHYLIKTAFPVFLNPAWCSTLSSCHGLAKTDAFQANKYITCKHPTLKVNMHQHLNRMCASNTWQQPKRININRRNQRCTITLSFNNLAGKLLSSINIVTITTMQI